MTTVYGQPYCVYGVVSFMFYDETYKCIGTSGFVSVPHYFQWIRDIITTDIQEIVNWRTG